MTRIRTLIWRISTIRTRRLARQLWGEDAPTNFDDIAARAVAEQVVSEQDLFDAALEGIAARNGLTDSTPSTNEGT